MITVVREPRVYLMGRPSLVKEGWKAFFDDEGVGVTIAGEQVTDPPQAGEEAPLHWETDTDNAAELLCMAAGKICYDAFGKGRSDTGEYLGHIIESKHGSVLEHAVWNFIIAGVSRVFSHEHVRHRAGIAISQRSQRYVSESASGQALLPMIEANPEAKRVWEEAVAQSQGAYDKLVQLLAEDLREHLDKTLLVKTVRSAARSVMPNSTETYLFWSANARALRHYIEMRGSRDADIEIRKVAIQMLKIMQREAPNLFGDYRLVDLPDDTQEAQTEHTKV
ncbi:MAG: FAD-dependent thymidylate synthase [Nitrospinae bacterium]|nr:FAD-dependent thymidylate synthase [Nitrospinota bacterium]